MGGHACIIPGSVAPGLAGGDRARAPERAPSLWGRLLGRGASPAPRETRLPNGTLMVEIPAAPLERALIADFRAWVQARIPAPSRGTGVVLEYLRDIPPSVYVRGMQGRGEPAPGYYLQVSFSGCAGEAETSARAAGHWTGLWYASERARLTSAYLVPFGFTPDDDPTAAEPMAFLPAGDLGYLEYVPQNGSQEAFELDHSAAEAHDGDPRLERLVETFAPLMRDGRCRCQICDPSFGDATGTA